MADAGLKASLYFRAMFAAAYLPYEQTGAFSKIVIDYLDQEPGLQPFFSYPPTLDGIRQAISAKKNQPHHRTALTAVLKDQYQHLPDATLVTNNIEALLDENTFTVTTAHQPNILTGPLYFIYKILHTIKLAQQLQQTLPHRFVPVFYMGSEDADLEELNHISVQEKTYTWQTAQKGAVGRMKVDEALMELIVGLEGQLSVMPFGKEWTTLLKKHYQKGTSIQAATQGLLHELFGRYGLVVLIADDARLKKTMLPIFEDDLFGHSAGAIVAKTSAELGKKYKAQAATREVNLFYLREGIRERIDKTADGFVVHNTDIVFSKEAMLTELRENPERFSPNVILRGLYQETVLPNVAFIGGGGELAYWLQLKELFAHYKVAFPVLLLRNSYTILEEKWSGRMKSLGLNVADLFQTWQRLCDGWVQKNSANKLHLNGTFEELSQLYEKVATTALTIDPTLDKHIASLKQRHQKNLQGVERKMMRAERKKQEAALRKLAQLQAQILPGGSLQERKENVGYFYACWGYSFIEALLQNAPVLNDRFTIINVSKPV